MTLQRQLFVIKQLRQILGRGIFFRVMYIAKSETHLLNKYFLIKIIIFLILALIWNTLPQINLNSNYFIGPT